MALIVRIVSAAGRKVLEKPLKTGINKLDVPEGAHVEIVDQATGVRVEGVRTVDANGNTVLSFARPEGEVSLDLGSSAGSNVSLAPDASSAGDASSPTSPGVPPGASEDHDGGRSATPILLGILGLGALGGVVAAAGGGWFLDSRGITEGYDGAKCARWA